MLAIDLSGRLALVTGASGQLGRVIARTLATAGADIAVHYLTNREQADTVCADIRSLGRRAAAVQADVGDQESVEAMQRTVAEQLGEPDIVVCNAVSQYRWTTVLEQEVADYESQFRSCVMQNVLMAKAFAPAMIARGWGRFVATSTECAMQNAPNQSAYVSGKRGMDGVLRVLAKELGPNGITVNQVAPGWTISERHRASGTERSESYERNVPLRRRGEDFDIANAVAFFASDLAGFITGVFLPVSGGTVMPAI
ncbi:SDR family oxidoreductase [Candidatus Poribacteria bacterium]|nr:SDR family oxidoreductase [Candidatus Poribacteria bacterium]